MVASGLRLYEITCVFLPSLTFVDILDTMEPPNVVQQLLRPADTCVMVSLLLISSLFFCVTSRAYRTTIG